MKHRLQTSVIKVGAIFAIMFGLMSGQAVGDIKPSSSGTIVGVATDVGAFGLFRIEDLEFATGIRPTEMFRLWGVHANPAILKELIEGKRVYCGEYGKSYARNSHDISILVCKMEQISDEPNRNRTLNAYLIQIGAAIEICSETFNRYQTCADGEWPWLEQE